MKKIFSAILLILFLAGFIPATAGAEEDGNYFIVTAYYSPLPDQEYYITGNYEDEKILNGQGIAGASGKGVFSGMLAAPAKYSFGTKIYIDGLGIGAVEDRGGAIVPAGERGYSYDRIDVWMGYGDEGLLRANFWGKRKVYGYVVDSGNATTLNYTDVPAPTWATTGLQKTGLTGSSEVTYTQVESQNTESMDETVEELKIFEVSLGKGSDSSLVTEMQDALMQLGYIEASTGKYDDNTISAVYDFQIEHEIISYETDSGAGYFGPKTREKLKELYLEYNAELTRIEEKITEIENIEKNSKEKAQEYIESLNIPVYGDISYEVRELQLILSELGYFDNKDTAIFGDITKQSILDYQLDREIIASENNSGAGVFGPKTREQISSDLFGIYFHKYLVENDLEEFYEEHLID